MNKINIALLAGGNSSERDIALQSAARVAESLNAEKYNVCIIDVQGTSWSYRGADGDDISVDKNDFSLTVGGTKIVFDYALIVIHGTPGEDGRMQGYLDMMGVPYSSGGFSSMSVTFDKHLCKKAVESCGINLAKQVYITEESEVDAAFLVSELGLPMFVKPTASGSSFGVTKVRREEDIIPAIEAARKESPNVLVEEFIEGTEVSCGILMTRDKEIVLPVTEIVSKRDFFDYEAKYTPGLSEEITPARIDGATLSKLNDMTRKAYKVCGCRGIVRIDFIIKEGVPYFIEINAIPGMSPGSIVPKQAAQAGLNLGELYDMVIEDTFTQRK